ncbi:MAG TPA: acylphosphatase [Candidatus Hydrogenedentes bacterium]|nr:acylphosphatase [Candidatus Hydrogenedentota bacterium]HOL75921.1 acylphosphatase [Candidatus Hydrogenedentota bacterium]HPO85670.1 acylphosphatase [Candidatus Hydrogenedentota bacterium]
MAVSRLHVLIDGRVQGVGFRYSLMRKAVSLRLTGWVRNLYDGRVEAEFEGTQTDLEKMLAWCHRGPPLAHVNRVESRWEEGEPRYHDFTIRG